MRQGLKRPFGARSAAQLGGRQKPVARRTSRLSYDAARRGETARTCIPGGMCRGASLLAPSSTRWGRRLMSRRAGLLPPLWGPVRAVTQLCEWACSCLGFSLSVSLGLCMLRRPFRATGKGARVHVARRWGQTRMQPWRLACGTSHLVEMAQPQEGKARSVPQNPIPCFSVYTLGKDVNLLHMQPKAPKDIRRFGGGVIRR